MKKNQFSYGIYLLVLVLLCSMLSGCFGSKDADSKIQAQESTSLSSQLQNEAFESFDEASQDTDNRQQEDDYKEETDEIDNESNVGFNADLDSAESVSKVIFEVEPGMYLTEILSDLVKAGWGESTEDVLKHLEQMDRGQFLYWSQIQNVEERAFAAEGYIAPGQYEWKEDASVEEVMNALLGSWDELLTEEIRQQAESQGYSVDEILIMASIVEWESSFAPDHGVKPNVAAVVRNRVESETPLQMDVTIFYLQESLYPYRDPQQYEMFYDTYIKSNLPAGPIGSPSMESIQAVLAPADTKDLFFVYDESGNYYFAEDYDQHLINCDLAGIY